MWHAWKDREMDIVFRRKYRKEMCNLKVHAGIILNGSSENEIWGRHGLD
jgi:hypothetical protein